MYSTTVVNKAGDAHIETEVNVYSGKNAKDGSRIRIGLECEKDGCQRLTTHKNTHGGEQTRIMRQNGNNIIEHYLCIWVRYQQHMYRCSAVSCLRLLSFPFCFDYVRIENHMKRQCGLLAWCRCSMVHASSICRRTKCAKCERNSFAVDAYGLKDYWHLVIESETFSFYFWCRSQRRCCGSDCVVFLASSLVFLCRLRTKYVWFEAVRCENIIHLLPLLSVALRFRWLCPHTCECDASLCVCATEYFYGNRNSRRVFNAHACSPECSTTNTNNELHFH